MKCVAYYRTYAGENTAPRPPWYSKELCLQSFILAFSRLRTEMSASLILLHDGEWEENTRWSDYLHRHVSPIGTLLDLKKSTNAKSCLDAVRRASELDTDTAVIFAEDDYLWLASSVVKMINAMSTIPADYVTGYDHPVRYQPDYPRGADLPHWDPYVYCTADHHWRTQESTCMTFASTAGVLREDLEVFVQHHNNGRNYPDDRVLFRHLQSLGEFSYRRKRRLVGPIPSLNTHAHLPWLAPVVDWTETAKDVAASSDGATR